MNTIALVYGSDTGNTEDVVKRLAGILGEDKVDLIEIINSSAEELSSYEKLILATSTWGSGDLQSDWEDFEDNLDEIDFSCKTVALLGLGDQESYADTFCDALSLIYDKVKAAKVVGFTSTEGYEFEESESIINGEFMGLIIDEDNQEELTNTRLESWVIQIKDHFL